MTDLCQIILGGDSAGANLAIGILAHLTHPHPNIPALKLSKPLLATTLLSPWVSFNPTSASFKINAERDLFGPAAVKRWSAAFLGPGVSSDNYSEPRIAPVAWWRGTEKVVDYVLIWAGGDEVSLDSIEEFAKKFKEVFGERFDFIVTPHEAHTQMTVDRALGYKVKSKGEVAVETWLNAKL